MNQRGLTSLPRNWRVISVASLTTLGLAYGAGQPVQGDWWPLPKAKSEAAKAPVSKPSAPENGFSSTIHRLMSDARMYADKGEFDKAVQLAERAAKISEASSQLLGPASDCSPEQTAQFANDLRARRDAVAKRTAPARVAPVGVAVAPKPQPTTPRSRDVPSDSPPIFSEFSAEKTTIVERADTEQPAEAMAESRESKLAWANELPPTPAPEPEPLNKPIKFRRSVLARAGHSIDEDAGDASSGMEESVPPSSADSAIVELLDAEFTDGSPIESPPTAPEAVASQTTTTTTTTTTPDEANISPPTEASPPSFSGEIQPVAAEVSTKETLPSPAAPESKTGWEDEAFAEELLLGKGSPAKSITSATGSTAAVASTGAPPFPEDNFPVQRVVQLRRRLETVASLNPGVTYTMPASPLTASERAVGHSHGSKPETPEPSNRAPSIKSPERANDWMTSADSTKQSESRVKLKPVAVPNERPVVRLREHRVMPDHVRTALQQVAALPPSPAARNRTVGYSEPMLWQSASESDSVLPTMSLTSSIGRGTNGSNNRAAESPPRDLRDLAHLSPQSDETHRENPSAIPVASVEQTGFRSIELPADSNPSTGQSGPALSSPRGDSAANLDSNARSSRTVRRSTNANKKQAATKSTVSDEISRQSFAIIEPLASALQLPIATTASLLGGTGLALLGLGLLLVRAAVRWRHS